MKETVLDIPWPAKGLVLNTSLNAQPKLTTPQAVNVRSRDPRTGRRSGAQRAGLVKYCPTAMPAAIQDINYLATEFNFVGSGLYQFTYIKSLVANNPSWGLANEGNLSVIGSGSTIAAVHVLNCTCWDQFNTFYGIIYTPTNPILVKVTSAGVVQYSVTPTGLPTVTDQAAAICTDSTYLYVVTRAGSVYRYLCVDGTSPDSGSTIITNACGDAGSTCRDMALLGGQAGLLGFIGINTVTPGAEYFSAKLWYTSGTAIGFGPNQGIIPGLNQASVCTDNIGTFYFGFSSPTGPTSSILKVPIGGYGTMTVSAVGEMADIDFDMENRRLMLVSQSASAWGTADSVATVKTADLTLIASTTPGLANPTVIRYGGANPVAALISNAAMQFQPLNSALASLHAAVILAGSWSVLSRRSISVNNGLAFLEAPHLSTRRVRGLVVGGGEVRQFTSAGLYAIASGTNVLSGMAPVVFSAQIQNRMYYVDGITYAYFDPMTNAMAQLVASSGSLPTDQYGYSARLCAPWRGRLVVSGLQFDPFNWFMSAINDPTNWNYAPFPSVETQAVAGNVSDAGLGPDIITALIAYNDEILLFGGDHTIHQMTGDPMSGGRIDLVSDETGIAWGRAWCKDPRGIVWFMSNKGTVYKMAPGSIPEQVSDQILPAFENINYGNTIIRLAWDETQQGFYLFFTQVGGVTITGGPNYFFDAAAGAWWQDQFAQKNHQPCALYSFDGDAPADRVVLIGGQDGYIRSISPSALDDDGTAISSSITLGPILDKEEAGITLADLQADLGSGNANWLVMGGSNAQDALQTPNTMGVGTFYTGRNRSQAVRVFGHALWVQLSSQNLVSSAWQLEYLRARVRVGEGSARQRQF